MTEPIIKAAAISGYVGVTAILGYHAWLAVTTVREYRKKMGKAPTLRVVREAAPAVSFGLTNRTPLK